MESWFAGIVDTSMRSKRALPISCCRVIWFRGKREENMSAKEEKDTEIGRRTVRNMTKRDIWREGMWVKDMSRRHDCAYELVHEIWLR